jgi:hypothetical protein
VTASVQGPLEGWVPVEHRVLGLDRRQFKPALFALVVGLLLAVGLPALNAAIPWDNETKAGDVVDLGDGATVVPPVGWQLKSGALVGGTKVTGVNADSVRVMLVKGGATLTLQGASFTGTATALLDQVLSAKDDDNSGVTGARASFTTGGGLVGVLETNNGPSGDELRGAFKMAKGTAEVVSAAPGLYVEVDTAPGQFEQYQDEVGALLRSITPGVGK